MTFYPMTSPSTPLPPESRECLDNCQIFQTVADRKPRATVRVSQARSNMGPTRVCVCVCAWKTAFAQFDRYHTAPGLKGQDKPSSRRECGISTKINITPPHSTFCGVVGGFGTVLESHHPKDCLPK